MFIEGISKETEERSRVSLREAVEIMARSLEEVSFRKDRIFKRIFP